MDKVPIAVRSAGENGEGGVCVIVGASWVMSEPFLELRGRAKERKCVLAAAGAVLGRAAPGAGRRLRRTIRTRIGWVSGRVGTLGVVRCQKKGGATGPSDWCRAEARTQGEARVPKKSRKGLDGWPKTQPGRPGRPGQTNQTKQNWWLGPQPAGPTRCKISRQKMRLGWSEAPGRHLGTLRNILFLIIPSFFPFPPRCFFLPSNTKALRRCASVAPASSVGAVLQRLPPAAYFYGPLPGIAETRGSFSRGASGRHRAGLMVVSSAKGARLG